MRAGEELDFPPGYGLDSMGDMTDMMIEFDRLLKGLIVSSVLIYLILVIQYGEYRSNFALANVKGTKEPWAIITDEDPTLQTLWQYALKFRIEELFLDSK